MVSGYLFFRIKYWDSFRLFFFGLAFELLDARCAIMYSNIFVILKYKAVFDCLKLNISKSAGLNWF